MRKWGKLISGPDRLSHQVTCVTIEDRHTACDSAVHASTTYVRDDDIEVDWKATISRLSSQGWSVKVWNPYATIGGIVSLRLRETQLNETV